MADIGILLALVVIGFYLRAIDRQQKYMFEYMTSQRRLVDRHALGAFPKEYPGKWKDGT